MTNSQSSITRENRSLYVKFLHIVIKGNEEAEKAAKQAIHMSAMTTTRLPHTDYYLTIRKTRNSSVAKGMGKWPQKL